MFGASEAQRAVAEGRINDCAVMRFRRLRMHIRPEILACDANPLRRNCLAELQAPDELDSVFNRLAWSAMGQATNGARA